MIHWFYQIRFGFVGGRGAEFIGCYSLGADDEVY